MLPAGADTFGVHARTLARFVGSSALALVYWHEHPHYVWEYLCMPWPAVS